jgi:hypothetical protein
MYRTNKLNNGSGSAAEILSRLPMRGATATQQNSEPAEVSPQSGAIRNERSHENGQAIQSSADTRSVFTNPGQGRPAEAMLEILDYAPQMIRKPLSLVEQQAYAVTWVYLRDRGLQHYDRTGLVDTPPALSERKQLIVRSDGMIFGKGFEDISRAGVEVHLHEVPKPEKLWSGAGIIAFQKGEQPEAVNVFNRITDIVDRFMDFNRSLADQQTMCELIACYILSTWFLDAFNVIGYLWSNGVHGSGKTQLLNVIAELGYLGDTILSGSTFASLRDRADYGATLGIDDAESFANARGMETDKRAIFLAGNRRGSTVTLKEQGPDKKWRTRHVSVYCPKLFSAIRQPEEILASRTVVIPLIRSANPMRSNANPSDYGLWPHDRRKLIDDLWALSLSQLPIMSPYEAKVSKLAHLSGRNLEPWLAMLAIAAWLDDNGISGMFERIEKVSYRYQRERQQLESDSITALLVRALYRCIGRDISDTYDTSTGESSWFLPTATIFEALMEIAEQTEANIDVDSITTIHVGILLGSMRFESKRTSNARGWVITWDLLQHWASSFNLRSS